MKKKVTDLSQALAVGLPVRHSVPLVLSAEDTGKAVGLRYGLEFPGASVL